MLSIEDVSVMIAAISVIIGVINHIITSRDQNRIQQSRLFMELYSLMRSKDFVRDTRELSSWLWEDFEDFRNKYGSRADKEANTLFISVANFFDGIGVLVRRNELDPGLVEELMSSWIIWFWEKFGDIIVEYRKVSYPQYLESVEFLYDKIQPIAMRGHPGFNL